MPARAVFAPPAPAYGVKGGSSGGTYAGPMPELETTGDYRGQQTEAQGQQPQHLRGLV